MQIFCTEDIVPVNHLLRIIDKAIDWNFIYELVEDKQQDILAVRVVERFAQILGNSLAVYSCVVDPDVIVIGGGVSKAGEALIDVVAKYFRRDAFPVCRDTEIVLAELGNDAGIYGAAKMVLDAI